MSKAGHNTWDGTNYQAWASLCLFLQYLKDPNFTYIQLEGENLEDFTLYFKDGTKIICEAKVRKVGVGYPILKEILKNVVDRKTFQLKDKILLVCTKVSEELVNDVKSIKYFNPTKEKFKNQKKFTQDQIDLIEYVDFWIVNLDFNKQASKALLADILGVWLPEKEIELIVNSLTEKFRAKSAKGDVYSRDDIFKEITDHKERVIKESPDYNQELVNIEAQFNQLEQSIDGTGKKGHLTAPANLKAWSANFSLVDFAKRQLEMKVIDNLKEWDAVWQMNRLPYFAYGIFNTFDKNLHTPENRDYIIQYCKKYSKEIRSFYRDDYFIHNVIDVLKEILDISADSEKKTYLSDIFEITKTFLYSNQNEIFYLKENPYGGHIEWRLKEICTLVEKLYQIGNSDLKDRILTDLVWGVFNLTEDEDTLSQRTPEQIYFIVHDWLIQDLDKNFPIFIKKIVGQYKDFYQKFSKRKKKNIYNGWEHIGGSTSFGGSRYQTGDRHFIGAILERAIRSEYDKNPSKIWKFIKEKCFIAKETAVSDKKPDFLNRAVYEVILRRYADKDPKVSDEAFDMLKSLLSHRRGIPHKSDLIYQSVARSGIFTVEKEWQIVNISLKKWKIPINSYIEEIIQKLAKNGHANAKKTLRSWYNNERYHEQWRTGGSIAIETIRVFIEIELDFSIELLNLFISSNHFTSDKFDLFNTYDIARLIADITTKSPEKGIAILNSLADRENWCRNERSLFCFGLFNHHEKDKSQAGVLLYVYKNVVAPFLKKYKGTALVEKIPEGGFRSAIVQFADALTYHSLYEEALSIVELFINDPDPYLPGQSPDSDDEKYNEHKKILEGEDHQSITSVRGWCGWVLMGCGVSGGRNQIDKTIKLTERLVLKDQNYYVIHMASFALSQLAKNRLTHLQDNVQELFLDPDREKALKKALRIEGIAFKLLKRILTFPVPAQDVLIKSALHVFDNIRSLNEKDAKAFLNVLQKFSDEALSEAIPLFMYYALFRKESYKKFRFAMPGLYDDINPKLYDEKVFKQILEALIKRLQSASPKEGKENADLCFKIVATFEHILREGTRSKKMEENAIHFTGLVCESYGHNVFTLVYRFILDNLNKSQPGFDKWYDLLIKALKTELQFYRDKNLFDKPLPTNAQQYYWYPSLYNREILEKLHTIGQEKFLEVAEIIFSFPLEFELHVDGQPIELLKKMADNGSAKSKEILIKLYKSNPGKWRDLKKYNI